MMRLVYISFVILLCVVFEIRSERTRSGECNGCESQGYTRIKRAKYYSSPPLRFYRRPPITFPIKGAFSYTPPPGYMMDDDEQPSPNLRPKVSKRPTNGGLGDEDINNIVKYLSKQDLDKVIEFATEKERGSKYNKESYEGLNYINSRPDEKHYEGRIITKGITPEADNDNRFLLNGPYVSAHESFRPYDDEYNNPNDRYLFKDDLTEMKTDQEPTALFINKQQIHSNIPLESDERVRGHTFSFPHTFPHEQSTKIWNRTGDSIFTDSSMMQEEQLPLPLNLRDHDYEASFTNKVVSVVKANSDSYKVENLGDLPLMNYHSKLDSVDSYRVPHYTVTSSIKHGQPASQSSSIKIPPVEPAPPASSARDQSDAHLKVIKIWTHKSQGTAYTLHDDGTLSLERPTRSKTYFEHP